MESGKYDDIINLPHPTPTCKPRMSRLDRAAQFAPFAALTGYEAVVEEAARLTDARSTLTEDMKTLLNDKMQIILDSLDSQPFVIIAYFVPDERKAGGSYVEASGIVEKIDGFERCIIMKDGTKIPIEQIRGIESDLFCRVDI